MPECLGASEYRSCRQERQNSLIHGCFSKVDPDSSSLYCKAAPLTAAENLGTIWVHSLPRTMNLKRTRRI